MKFQEFYLSDLTRYILKIRVFNWLYETFFILGAIHAHQMKNPVHRLEKKMVMPVHNLEMIRETLNPLFFFFFFLL